MKNFIDFNPVRTLTAVGVLGQAIIVLLAAIVSWDATLILQVETVWAGVLGVFGSLFVSPKAVSRVALDQYAEAVEANETALAYEPGRPSPLRG